MTAAAAAAAARRSFKQGVVCGFMDSGGRLLLNPEEGAVPGPGSRLVQLSRKGENE
jgi:hypothetical protein